jgi:hypothetical protein
MRCWNELEKGMDATHFMYSLSNTCLLDDICYICKPARSGHTRSEKPRMIRIPKKMAASLTFLTVLCRCVHGWWFHHKRFYFQHPDSHCHLQGTFFSFDGMCRLGSKHPCNPPKSWTPSGPQFLVFPLFRNKLLQQAGLEGFVQPLRIVSVSLRYPSAQRSTARSGADLS